MQRFLDIFGYGLCHQIPARSFEAGGLVFPVCARDTGMYLAILVTLAALALLYRGHVAYRRVPMPVAIILICIFLPFPIDGITSYLGIRETTNAIRYATGYGCGVMLGVMLFRALCDDYFSEYSDERLLGDARRAVPFAAASALIGIIFYVFSDKAGPVGPLITVVAIIATFAAAIGVLLSFSKRLMDRFPEGSRLVPIYLLCIAGSLLLIFVCAAAKLVVLGAAGHLSG